MSLLPTGKFFIASPAEDRKNYVFDPGPETLALAGDDVVPESEPGEVHGAESWKGTGVLLPLVPSLGGYPHPRFALINGVEAYVKDLGQANPTWQRHGDAATRAFQSPSATYANATLLPTGQVLVTGGVGP